MIKIREANKTDIPFIVDFQLIMAMESEGMELELEVLQNGVRAVFDDPGKGIYYVAEYKGAVVGSMLNTFEWSDWRNGTIIWFQSVYVKPEFRKLGIFKEMYLHIKHNVIHDDSMKGMRLYVDSGNERAQKVYQALGMTGDHYDTYEWMK
ncbi:MAG: GNAT family N-acetyltransferase [Bacteroidetes bacterium HGW-Bacteroidetes-17]|jgi:GNAT superfamily N-acetyltransferase|nr:MAG: GNAT family N-acetyltransferase [Bacteroidetes bacterium HGW-Bacteroidetes-17]